VWNNINEIEDTFVIFNDIICHEILEFHGQISIILNILMNISNFSFCFEKFLFFFNLLLYLHPSECAIYLRNLKN